MNNIFLTDKERAGYENLFGNLGATENKTVRKIVLDQEAFIEDHRVPQALRVQTLESRRQKLFARQMKTLLGDSEIGLFNDNAPIGKFATNALERLDMNIRHQALRTYATRDIPFEYGGGAIESIKGFKEAFEIPSGGFIGGDTNQVRIVKVNFQPLQVDVKALVYGLQLGLVDALKNGTIGYDAIAKDGQAIQRSYFLDLDRIGYFGDGANGTNKGLLNQTGVINTDLETTPSYGLTTEKKLEKLGIEKNVEILTSEVREAAQLVDFDPSLAINKILFYNEYLAFLSQTAQNAGNTATPFRTNRAILQEALDSTTLSLKLDRIELEFLPYLSANAVTTKGTDMVDAGTNDTGKIVMYRQDPYVGYLGLPMELTGGAIVFDINTNSFRRNYLAFVSYLLWFYSGSIRYISNGTTTGGATPDDGTPGE